MIETFELEGGRNSSAIDPQAGERADPRNGGDLVADAVAKPVSDWLPRGRMPRRWCWPGSTPRPGSPRKAIPVRS